MERMFIMKVEPKFKAFLIDYGYLYVDVVRINFDCKTVECNLISPDEGDLSEFSFDKIHLWQRINEQWFEVDIEGRIFGV